MNGWAKANRTNQSKNKSKRRWWRGSCSCICSKRTSAEVQNSTPLKSLSRQRIKKHEINEKELAHVKHATCCGTGNIDNDVAINGNANSTVAESYANMVPNSIVNNRPLSNTTHTARSKIERNRKMVTDNKDLQEIRIYASIAKVNQRPVFRSGLEKEIEL